MPDLEPVRAINESLANVRLARSARNEWVVTVPAGTRPEHMLIPEYWKHLTHLFRVGGNDGVGGDIIVMCADRSWRANYEILDIGATGMTLVILKADSDGVCRYSGEAVDLPLRTKAHYVEWINIGTMWTVRRTSDNEIEKNKFQSAQLAAAYMHRHYGEMAA